MTFNGGGLVIDLDLNRESISGGIDNSSSLFDLRHLPSLNLAQKQYLPSSFIDLNQNQFTGRIDELSRLSSSAHYNLGLRDDRLEGPFPEFVFQLRSLMFLELSYNNFNGLVNLSSFQQLRNLSTLDLSDNN